MAAGRIVIEGFMPALDLNGSPVPGAKLTFFNNRTTTLASIFTDYELSVPHANPVIADAAGQFDSIFADASNLYTITITDGNNVPVGVGSLDDVRSIGEPTNSSFALQYDEADTRTLAARFQEMPVSVGEFSSLVVPGVGGLPDNWTLAINTALESDRNVYLPGRVGGYYVKGALLNRPAGNMLVGDGVEESYLVIDGDFDMAAVGVLKIPASASELHAGLDNVGFVFKQPGANHISAIAVATGGTGYTSVPTVTITGGGGSGAMARAVLTAGVVTSIVITRKGEGYTSSPTVTITGGGGTGATAGTVTRVATVLRSHMIQYPPAIYARNVARPFFGNVRVTGGWDGFDLRDNTGGLMGGRWELGTINCAFRGGGADGASPALDFWNVDTIRVWPHGFQDAGRLAVWLDGAGEGTKIGRIDGVSIKSLGGYGVEHTLQGTAFDVSYVSDGADLTYDYAPPVPGGAASVEVYTENANFERTLLTQGVAYTVAITSTGGTITLAAPVAAGLTIRIILTTIVYGPFGSIGDLKVDGNTAHLLAEAGEIAFGTVYGSTAIADDYKIKSTGAKLTIPSWWFLGHPDADTDMIQVENGGSIHLGHGTCVYLGENQSLASVKDAGSVLTVMGAYFGRCANQTRIKAFIRQSDVGGYLTATGNVWEAIGAGTGAAVELLDNGLHNVTDNNLNGWGLSIYDTAGAERQGVYGPNAGQSALRRLGGGGSVVVSADTHGYLAGDASATGTITVSGTPVANETFVVGGQTFTFKAARTVAGEVTISAVNATQARNILAAIQADVSATVTASVASAVVTVTAVATGTAGNSVVLTEAATGVAVSGSGTLSGGGTGTAISTITGGYDGQSYTITATQDRDFVHGGSVKLRNGANRTLKTGDVIRFTIRENVSIEEGVSVSSATSASITPTPAVGAFTSAAATISYNLIDGECVGSITLVITTIGTATGPVSYTLPYTAFRGEAFAAHDHTTGVLGGARLPTGTATLSVCAAANTMLGTTGSTVVTSFRYRIA
jgi:hypothetical protein